MSLEPKWYSTIYPWYVFAGAFEAGIAGLVVLLMLLRKRGILTEVNEHHLHNLGKLLFAFSVFWAYLWFSQYLLIWYSNIPEETTFYVRRLSSGAWASLFWLNLVANFGVPFALLLAVSRKKKESLLLGAGVLLLAGHWLDLYMLVMPPVLGASPRLGLLEVLIFAGLAAVYLFLFDRSFAAADPLPVGDPYLQESLHFEGV
jgi:Ni/Fe-hydrogenase subunit HybB-like protein